MVTKRTAYEGRDGDLYASEREAICSLLGASAGGAAQDEVRVAIYGPNPGCGESANAERMRSAILAAAKIISGKSARSRKR